jgi:integrase
LPIKLNERNVAAIKPASGVTASGQPKRDEVHTDSELRGFALRVSRTGKKTFFVQKDNKLGKTRRVAIGPWPAISAEEARGRAKVLLAGMHTEGVDEIASANSRRRRASADDEQSDLIRDLLESYKAKHLQSYGEHSRNMTYSGLCRVFADHGDLRLKDFTTADLTNATDFWRDKGQMVTANRRTEQVRTFVNWCEQRGVAVPHLRYHRTKEKSRDRVLEVSEMVRVLAANDTLDHLDYPDCIRLLVLTGLRRTEVSELHWSEVDLENRVLNIPAARMKNGLAARVPLSGAAVELLEHRRKFVPSGYVFARWSNGKRAFSGFSRLKVDLDAAIATQEGGALEHWVHHDLRRTVATLMVEKLDADPTVVDMHILHHVSTTSGVARTYNRAKRLEKVRTILDDWGRYVTSLTAENVVSVDFGEGRART